MNRFNKSAAGVVVGSWLALASSAHAAEIELKVLVVAVGTTAEDPARAAVEKLLNRVGVPYTVLDASRENLTQAALVSGSRGRYNGILLTQSETFLPSGQPGFDASEFAILHNYERSFGVREAVLSGFPSTNPTLGLDYGMATIASGTDLVARFVGPSGGTEIFEYVNTANDLPTQGFAFVASARAPSPENPVVTPLLVSKDDPSLSLVSRIAYPDGREVMLSTINNAPFFLHTSLLAYEFLNFATKGLFIGARRAYLEVHNDDMYLPDAVWDPETESNFPEETFSFRLTGPEVAKVVEAQRSFRAAHPLAAKVTTDIAFNGAGSTGSSDGLTQALRTYRNEFGFINHTFRALQMDRLCPEGGYVPDSGDGDGGLLGNLLGGLFGGLLGGVLDLGGDSSTPSDGAACVRTDYQTAYDEINLNANFWSSQGFPAATAARYAVLTDNHSGLIDRRGTADTSDDIQFPAGFNKNLGDAAARLGVRMLAGDASRQNQDTIQKIPNFNIALMPRYPTALFYNTTTPDEVESEYNYIFHYRYIDAGQDPCTIPGALCTPRNYPQILASEADTTLRHILAYDPYPHYFHQTNLHVYDAAGHILQFEWLDAVLTAYERHVKLPLESPRFHELADLAWKVLDAKDAQPVGVLNTATNQVTFTARNSKSFEVTGLSGGTLYGGQYIRSVSVRQGFFQSPTRVSVDAALTR